MSYQNRYIFSNASPGDVEGIRQLFSSQNFDGDIAVQYLRGDNPISSFLREGDDFVCLILRDTQADNNIIGMGSCVIREGYVNGIICNIGYLTGLKLHPDYHKNFLGISKAYQWIYENTKGKVDYYYTTILADNIYVQKMLEKKRKSMPLYNNIGEYHTLIFKAGGAARLNHRLEVKICDNDVAENFYKTRAIKHLFSVSNATQNDLANSCFFALYRGKEIIAVASVLDQREYKQYIVKKYSGIYNILRFLPTALLGYPSFPKLNDTVSLASMSIYHENTATEKELLYLFRQVLSNYNKTELIMIGLHDNHPLLPMITTLKHVSYKSKLYWVSYNHHECLNYQGAAGVDIAFC